MQFSIKVLLLLTLAASVDAWSMNVGGTFFIAPLGCLTCGCLCGVYELWQYWKSPDRRRFLRSPEALRGCTLLAVSISLFLLYAPFMELAVHYRDSDVLEQRALALIEKNAETILAEGRCLIACTQTNERITCDSPRVPPSIRALNPERIDNQGGSLLVYTKPGNEPMCLRIFEKGQPGFGGKRLIPGLWLDDRSTPELI